MKVRKGDVVPERKGTKQSSAVSQWAGLCLGGLSTVRDELSLHDGMKVVGC